MIAKSLMLISSNMMTFSSVRAVAFQFGCNNLVEVRWWSTPEKPGYKRAFFNHDRGTISNFTIHLTIGGKNAVLRTGEDLKPDLCFGLQDQRTIRGEVRRDRRQDATLDLGMQQRTTHSHIVCSRAGGSRENHPVGVRCIVIVIVDPYLHLHHARPLTTSNNDIVERKKLFMPPILIKHSPQHRTLINPYRGITLEIEIKLIC